MAAREMKRILVTGAAGQIGSELTLALRERYGAENVVAAGHRTPPSPRLRDSGPFEFLDVTQRESLERVVDRYAIDTIYHMAAILSATGEQKPQLAWQVNMGGLYNVLEVARERNMVRLFCPSSMAVFGPEAPKERTPQETVLRPTTIYGVTKVAGELLCNYYFHKYGLDVRGLRYPGIISAETFPGGGTTDYAVAIFYEAILHGHYTCFVREDTVLPMMYMPDCIRATISLMEADLSRLRYHADYNVAALSFSAGELQGFSLFLQRCQQAVEEAPRGHGESPPGIGDVPIPQPTDQVQGPIPQGGQGRPYLPPRAAQYFLPRSHIPRRDPSPSRAPKSSIATIPTKGNLRPLRPRGSGTRAMIRPRRLWGWTSSLMPHLLAPDSPRLYPFVRTLKSPGGTGGGDPQAHPHLHGGVQARLPPGHRRFLAAQH